MNIASDINTYRACLLLFSLTLSMSCGCGDETDDCPEFEATEATIEVMPIGDSRVEGARPEFESYRYELWKNLKQDNWDVDFIGARFDPASYPEFGGTCFDNEHEGTGGAQTPDILDTLNRETYPRPPEVALLGIGGNDLLNSTGRPVEEVVSNVESIIARLRELNPNVIILMEQIAPGKSDFMSEEQTNRFDTYNV
ncbi:MAG: SGNH/GDSL hydrolase family protein, partial [Myxococcota bacterium]